VVDVAALLDDLDVAEEVGEVVGAVASDGQA
jgi:hypothetical protein